MTTKRSPAVTSPDRARSHGRRSRPDATSAAAERSRVALRLPSASFLLLLLLSLVVIGPLLQPGYFWGAHDARHDVYFLFQFDQSVQEGNWFPRWGPDWAFGYGYPFWIVYAPLAVFVAELFHHFLGLGWEASVKVLLGLSVVLSGVSMYGFVRSWLGRGAALVAGVAYMIVPYHLVDVYVRATMPESVSFVFLPLILWGFRETILRPRFAAIIGAGLAYAALMWTSNLVALVFTPPLALYALALLVWKAKERAGNNQGVFWRAAVRGAAAPAVALAIGLGLSAAFFVPALLEARHVNQGQWFGEYYSPFQHFVYFHQLFSPAWGFGISQPGPDDIAQGSMSYQLGAVPALLALVSTLCAGRLGAARGRELRLWGLWALAGVFLTLGISAPVWRYVPLVPFAQFPWRYLMLAILPLSILPGALAAGPSADESDRSALRWPAVLLAALLMLSSYSYLRVEMREPTPEQGPVSYAALMRFQRTSNEMTGVTAWVDEDHIPTWSPLADEWVAGREVTTKVDYGLVPQNETLAVNAENLGTAHEEIWYHAGLPDQSITFNRFWYPGWRAYLLDGKGGSPVQELPVEREEGPLARVVVPVPVGESYLLLRFEDTPLRAAAKFVTVVTFGLVVLVSVWHRGFTWKKARLR